MKKTFSTLALIASFIAIGAHADSSSLGTVGIDQIEITQEVTSAVKIKPTFFNVSDKDQATILEVSITDTYSEAQLLNVDKLTSEVLDAGLVIPTNTTTYPKTYIYALPNISKKDTYRIELRVLDRNRNMLYLKQSDPITLGTDDSVKTANLNLRSRFEYDAKSYGLNDGPIIKSDKKDTAFYVFEVSNVGDESVTISTEYSSRKYAAAGSEFVKNEGAVTSTVIARKSKQTIKIPAKYFDDNGTFEGKIDIFATQGQKTTLLRTEGFRYMIGDSFIVVTDIAVSTTSARLGISKTLFDSATVLTKEVLNSTSSAEIIKAQNDKAYTFILAFKDAAGMDVITHQATQTWAELMPAITLPITLTNKERTKIQQVEVRIVDESGKQMFKDVFAVSSPTVDAMTGKEISLIVGLVLFILSMIGYITTRRKGWLVCILLFLVGVLYVQYSNIFATSAINSGHFSMTAFANGANYPTSSGCWEHGYRGLTMSPVHYPSPTYTFKCGSTISVRLDPVNSTCANTAADTYFVITSTKGLTVKDKAYSPSLGKDFVVVYRRDVGGVSTPFPIKVVISPGFTGTATLIGYYLQANGQCSSQTTGTIFSFKDITCTTTCACNGRNNVCTRGGVTTTTTKAAECALSANCSVAVNGDQATFTTTVVRGLGTISYKDGDTGLTISNPVTRTIPVGGSVTQNTTVKDAFDDVTAGSSCTATRAGGDDNNDDNNNIGDDDMSTTTPDGGDVPTISQFNVTPSIVRKGDQCKFSWQTENMSLCSFRVNGTDMTPSENKNATDVAISTLDGNNKLGILTCISSSTPRTTLTASTTCRVNPEVRQQ